MKKTYRLLNHGEIVLATDERHYSDHPWHGGNERWDKPQDSDIGQPAPDPKYPAHRLFRRAI